MSNAAPERVIVRTPVAAVVQKDQNSHLGHLVKIFTWMTGAFLAAAIVIALISGSIERDNLRDEVSRQSTELVCRTLAAAEVAEANTARDNTIAETVVAVANGDSDEVMRLLDVLAVQTKAVDVAIKAQEEALEGCATN